MTPSEADRSYGTYDKNHEDDFSDDYKSYEVIDIVWGVRFCGSALQRDCF